MPPFVLPTCPHCQKKNRFDFAELQKNPGTGMVYRSGVMDAHEDFVVTCQNCGQKFKFTAKVEQDGKAKNK
jgi:RNase P subunit RPR2